ncbi:MAG: YveK family protein [Chloroflexota bacterium]
MELRAYWQVLWRWRWLALAVAIVTFVASLAIQTREPTLFQSTLRLAVQPNIPQNQSNTSPAEQVYYEYVSAELLIDDVMEVVKSPAFNAETTKRASTALGKPAYGTIDTEKMHKLARFTVTADDPQQAQAMAKAIGDLLLDPQGNYFKMFADYEPTLTVVDEGTPVPAGTASRVYLYMLLRVALALIAGLGLAFLLEYLNDTVRNSREVETATGLRVLGEIPPARYGQRATGRAATAGTGGKVQTA